MLIKKLCLENIRSYKKQQIEFPQGSVLLSGDVGSGKSSILLAIEFALFGLGRKTLPGSALLRHDASKGSVELHLKIGEKDVIIKRVLKREKAKKGKDDVKQESGYIEIDGVGKAATPLELKTAIIDILNYPKNLVTKTKNLIYRFTVYTPQEEMKRILFEDPDLRLDILRKIFGVAKYKTIRTNADIVTKHIRAERRVLEAKFEGLGSAKTELEKKQNELQNAVSRLGPLKNKLAQLASKKEAISKSVKILQERQNEKRLIEKELSFCNAQIRQHLNSIKEAEDDAQILNTELADIKQKLSQLSFSEQTDIESELKKRETELKQIIEKRSGLLAKKEAITKELSRISSEIANKESSIARGEELKKKHSMLRKEIRHLDELGSALDQKKKFFEELKKEMHEIAILKKALIQDIARLERVQSCPLCLQAIPTKHKQTLLQNKKDEVTRLSARAESIEQELSKVQYEIKSLERKIDSLKQHEKEALKLEAELNTFNKERNELLKTKQRKQLLQKDYEEIKQALAEFSEVKRDELAEKIDSLKRQLKEIQLRKNLAVQHAEKEKQLSALFKTIARFKKAINQLQEQKETLQNKLKEFEGIEERLKEENERMQQLAENERKTELEKVALEKGIESIKRELERAKKDLDQKISAKERFTRLGKIEEWLNSFFLKMTEAIEMHVMARIRQQFSELFQQWFSILVPDEELSIRLNESFGLVVEQDGYETSLENLSGGEKTAAALAYRLALNKVMNDLISNIKTKGLLILDEPTDGFSSEQLDRMRDVLEQLVASQVLIVSHESKIEEFVEHTINIYKHGHVSKVLNGDFK